MEETFKTCVIDAGRVTIPHKVRNDLDIHKGDAVQVTISKLVKQEAVA